MTLQFLEGNGDYMNLSDTVIKIDTASMIQEIGDLAPLYPGQASFSAATRLRFIKIGDSTPGYNNPHITNTETGAVDFGANYMLEHLEVQNLSNANQPLNLTGCPALTYLDAHGSSFTSVTFANGGLLSEAYINNPVSLIMRNLDLLTASNFHLTDPTAVTQLRLEGCKLFDNKSFVESLTNLEIIRLSGINWSLNTNTLLNRLLDIMGMDELGYTVAQSYLAGNVSLTGTVYQGDHNRYVAAWSPDLTINVDNA